MAILTALPHQAIVDGFKGKVDFYLWKGIPCARKWPRWPKRRPYPDERENQQAFAYINKIARYLPPWVQAQYRAMATGTPFTWKDLLVRAYMRGIPY